MPQGPNKLSLFWQELKRRKVLKVIAMYAGAAYVLIELANNVVEPLNLPDWTPRLTILLALVGFPIMLVLSWIFDITPEGLNKTESLDKLAEPEQVPSTSKRKLKASDVTIIVLVVLVGILAYPRIFGMNSLNAMTMPVTVENEFGERETRRVYKKDYISKLCIFPFKNESKDSILDWLQYGIPQGVFEDLYQFSYMYLDADYGSIHFQEQLTYAKINKNSHFLTGDIHVNNGVYKLTSRLYQVANGAVVAERIFEGRDVFNIIDSISYQTRIDLGIPELILSSSPDTPISGLLTENIEAYRIFIENGVYQRGYSSENAYLRAYPAIELDSTFAFAMYGCAQEFYGYQISRISALKLINQAMRHRHRLSEYREIDVRRLYYMIQGDAEKAVALTEMQLDQKPFDIKLLLDLIEVCQINLMLDKYEKTAYKLAELAPDHSDYQIELARACLLSGKLEKGLKVLNSLLKENPQNTKALVKMGEIYLHKNELEAAEEVYNKVMLLAPEEEDYWSMMLEHIAYIRNNKNYHALMESLIGNFRFEHGELHLYFSKYNNHLLFRAENQRPFFIYPVSDTIFVTIILADFGYLGVSETLARNMQGEVQYLNHQESDSPGSTLVWKEDSLIQYAMNLLRNQNISKVYPALQIAYEQNPEHYYLANFIRHLEFIQSPEYEKLKLAFTRYLGKYDDQSIYMENNQFFFTNKWGVIHQLLPLSEDRFMLPSKYDTQLQIKKEKETVSGAKFVLRDGDEVFYPRASN